MLHDHMLAVLLLSLTTVTYALNFTILSEPPSAFELFNLGNSCSTFGSEGCDLPVKENSLFQVRASSKNHESFQDLIMYGFYSAEGGAGNYTTYTGSRRQLQLVMKALELEYTPSKGVLVVGLDISTDGSNMPHSLEPAIGASVKSLKGVSSEKGFIYEGVNPVFGTTIEEGGSSFITFTNVDISEEFSIEISPPQNMQCALGPAGHDGGATPNVVSAICAEDVVSVVALICS